MKYLLRLLTIYFCISIYSCSNGPGNAPATGAKPKLVVGIVVDQMRWDYLYRYSKKYSQNGFKRLLREGYSCQNTHINYLPSFTAPGHTCIYTGSVPAIHGIAGNDWYDIEKGAKVYCVRDTTVVRVGEGKSKGNASPRNLLATTITDELRLGTNYQSKVVSVALKDRSSILPGGHKPNGAYYLDMKSGNFITTSYYMSQVPGWVDSFNAQKLPQKYLAQNWNTLLPINEYTESTPDDEPYERPLHFETKAVFPHNTSELLKHEVTVLDSTPYGNSYTFDFARAAIEGEHLGAGNFTDFLAVSLSSTDIVGHEFGPNSVETEDTYLRLDKDLENFLNYLDQKVGKGNYLVFLTADHGAAHSADYMAEENIPAGSFPMDTTAAHLNDALQQKFGKGEWILSHENMQVYLNHTLMNEKKIKREDVFAFTKDYLMQYKAIANVIDLKNISTTTLQADIKTLIVNGYNEKRSGDFEILYNPGWLEEYDKGTTHGTPYAYDTHIPLVWMGWKIKHAEDHSDIHMTDIAPTLAALLRIQEPSGSVGKVIKGVTDHQQ